MFVSQRPVGYQSYGTPMAGALQASPSPVAIQPMAPVAVQNAGQPVGILQTLGTLVSNVFTFISNLLSKLFGGSTPAAYTPGVSPTPGLVASNSPLGNNGMLAAAINGPDATVAQQFGLRADAANVQNFRVALATAAAEPNAIGPGSNNPQAVTELQQLLAKWGYQVQVTGQFDAATADAVMRFKATNGLTDNFYFSNGDAGVTPFVDARTRAKMSQLLSANQTPAPGLNHVPGLASQAVASVPGVQQVAGLPTPSMPALPTPSVPTPPPPAPPPPPPPPAPVPSLPNLPQLPQLPSLPGQQPGVQNVANGLTADQQRLAQQAGILATPANVNAYIAVVNAFNQDASGIMPGKNDTVDAVSQLQQVLTRFGFSIPVTGKFDQTTINQVMAFKRQNGLTDSYQMADGSPGVNPFIDQRMKNLLMQMLNR